MQLYEMTYKCPENTLPTYKTSKQELSIGGGGAAGTYILCIKLQEQISEEQGTQIPSVKSGREVGSLPVTWQDISLSYTTSGGSGATLWQAARSLI